MADKKQKNPKPIRGDGGLIELPKKPKAPTTRKV